MGLIKVAKNVVQSMLADQWREYFYCSALPGDILVKKGQRKDTGGRNGNTKGSADIISNGSIIAVNEGQCMIIVDQGGVVDLCAEAGEYTFDSSTEPSLLYGDLGENVKKTMDTAFKRFAFGGNTAKDQRVYYVNTLEIMDNLFGTASPMPFLYVDDRVGIELEVDIKFNGTYSFRITDPLLFYKNVCGNVQDSYQRSQLQSTMKAELMQAMQPALAKLGDLRIRVSDIPKYTMALTEELNRQLSEKWAETRGIEVVSLNMNAPIMSQQAKDMINKAQMDMVYTNEDMRMVRTSQAVSQAVVDAAKNSAGSDRGILGMRMAMMMGEEVENMLGGDSRNSRYPNGGGYGGRQNAQGQYRQQNGGQQGMQGQYTQQGGGRQGMQGQYRQQNDRQQGMQGQYAQQNGMRQDDVQGQYAQQAPRMQPAGAAEPGWRCQCGYEDNRGRFCTNCGSKKPAEAGWTCSCGSVNQGKFCTNCGSRKPEGAPLYKCDKCGWEPEDPAHPPRFCPECGDAFDENDRI